MKKTKRNRPRRVAQTPRSVVGLRDSFEAKLLRVCADIGWICGWREERPDQVPAARRSSRKRVMLGRALATKAREQEAQAFRPVEATFVSSRRTAYAQPEPVAEASGLADFAIDLQDELARFGRMGISMGEVARALGGAEVRSLGRQLCERHRSML